MLVSDTRFIRVIRAGFLPVQERDGNNQVMREYTWGLNLGGGIGGLLQLNQGGLDYSYLYDGKGNVTALLDSNQSVVATYRYDAFGVLMTKTGTLDQPFQFSTKRYDEKTGLSYYGYRFYNPAIGKWITRDPIGELGGINLYGFVGNNPVNWIDPYGLIGWDTIGRWIGKQIAKQIGKFTAKKIMPDKGLNMPYEGDDDNDGTLNFMDPDSEYCQVNCTKPPEPSECK